MSPVGSQILPAGDGDTEWKAMSVLFQQHLSFLLAPTLGNIAQVKQFLCTSPHFSGFKHLLIHNLACAELGLTLSSGSTEHEALNAHTSASHCSIPNK